RHPARQEAAGPNAGSLLPIPGPGSSRTGAGGRAASRSSTIDIVWLPALATGMRPSWRGTATPPGAPPDRARRPPAAAADPAPPDRAGAAVRDVQPVVRRMKGEPDRRRPGAD